MTIIIIRLCSSRHNVVGNNLTSISTKAENINVKILEVILMKHFSDIIRNNIHDFEILNMEVVTSFARNDIILILLKEFGKKIHFDIELFTDLKFLMKIIRRNLR